MTKTTKNGLLVGTALFCGLALSAKPWMLVRDERAEAARQVRLAQSDEARMVRAQTEKARLSTELGKEERLRHQGYRKVGEVPFRQ